MKSLAELLPSVETAIARLQRVEPTDDDVKAICKLFQLAQIAYGRVFQFHPEAHGTHPGFGDVDV